MFLVEAAGARRGFKVDHPEQAGGVLPLDFDNCPGVNEDAECPGLVNALQKHLVDLLGESCCCRERVFEPTLLKQTVQFSNVR